MWESNISRRWRGNSNQLFRRSMISKYEEFSKLIAFVRKCRTLKDPRVKKQYRFCSTQNSYTIKSLSLGDLRKNNWSLQRYRVCISWWIKTDSLFGIIDPTEHLLEQFKENHSNPTLHRYCDSFARETKPLVTQKYEVEYGDQSKVSTCCILGTIRIRIKEQNEQPTFTAQFWSLWSTFWCKK